MTLIVCCACAICVSWYNWLSSAKAWCPTEWLYWWSGREVEYIKQRVPDQALTPEALRKQRGDVAELIPLTKTVWVLPQRYDLNQEREESVMPKVCSSLCRRMVWLIVSNAEERTNKVRMQTLPLSKAVKRSLTILSRAVSLLWWGLYADGRALSRSLELRWSRSAVRAQFVQ